MLCITQCVAVLRWHCWLILSLILFKFCRLECVVIILFVYCDLIWGHIVQCYISEEKIMDMTSMTEMYIIQKLEIPFGVERVPFIAVVLLALPNPWWRHGNHIFSVLNKIIPMSTSVFAKQC